MGKKAGWMKKSQYVSENYINGKPILNPENSEGENLYYIAFGGIVNAGLIGFDGYVYAFEEQEALDRVLDKYPNLGLSPEELSDYSEDEISYGGNDGIPYCHEDLRVIKLVKKAM